MPRLILSVLGILLTGQVEGQFGGRPSLGLICAKYDRNCRSLKSRAQLRSISKTFTINNLTPKDLIEKTCEKFIEEDINAILFINTNNDIYDRGRMLNYRFLMSLTSTLSIPLIGWNPAVTKSPAPGQNKNYLQLVPSIESQCATMFNLLELYNWKTFSIVTTATDGHKEFVSCLRRKIEDNEKLEFKLLYITKIIQLDESSIRDKLSEIPEEARIIVMHSTLEESTPIFSVANELSLTSPEHQWVVTKSVIASTERGCQPEGNCGFPDGCLGVSYQTTSGAYADLAKKAYSIYTRANGAFQRRARGLGLSTSPRKDINCTDPDAYNVRWTAGELFYEFLRNTTLNERNEKLKVEFTENGLLKESEMTIVNFRRDAREWKSVGKWNPVDKITLDEIRWPGGAALPPKDRPKKWKLRIVTLDEAPYIIKTDLNEESGTCVRDSMVKARWDLKPGYQLNPNGTIDPDAYEYKCLSGFAIDLLQKLEKDIGFEYEIFKVEDGKWGDNVTGEWDGLVRTLMDHKADICMTSLKINNDRADAISFSLPFLETGITIIVGIKKGVISPTAFLEPYDFSAWCLILVFSVHAVGTAIFVFEWLSPRGLDRGNTPTRDHKFSLFRSFWLIWAMLFGAAVDTDTPKGVASRFMGSIWALFALVFLASYTANLAAFMIAKEDFHQLQGLQDPLLQFPKANKPAFKYGTVQSGNTANVLRNNHKRLYTYMKNNEFLLSNKNDAIKLIKEERLDAFIYDATVLDYMAGKDKGCKLRTVGAWYAMTGYGIGFPKGDTKWLPRFNEQLMKYQQQGILEKLQQFWMAGACKTGNTNKRHETSHPLGIINFTSAYYLLAGGVLLAILLMLLEHLYFKFMRRKLGKWDKCGCCGLISLSMGKSLTFEQSVMEMLDVQKNFKCKNALCETSMWKVKHELDIALVRIDRLQNRLRDLGYKAVPKSPSLKSPNYAYEKKALGWKGSQQTSPSSDSIDEDSELSPGEVNGNGVNGGGTLLKPPTQAYGFPDQSTKITSPTQVTRIRFSDDVDSSRPLQLSQSPRLKNISGKTYRGVPTMYAEETEKVDSMESTL